jgi:cell wall-associated NlpC family hydrolase
MFYEPRPGDYGVVKTNGVFGKLIRVGTVSRWNHAFIYIGDGLIVEANPMGVVISKASKYEVIAWNQHETLTDAQRTKIVNEAKRLIGKSYGFLDIANLMLRILGLKLLANTSLLDKMAERYGVICSELVALSYDAAKIDVCGKPANIVTPGDLAERLIYQ